MKKTLSTIIDSNKWGLAETKAEFLLNRRLGRSIDWTAYRCTSLLDFVQRQASAELDVEPHSKLIRNKSLRPCSGVSTVHSQTSSTDSLHRATFELLDLENEERSRRCIEELFSDDDLSAQLQGSDSPRTRLFSCEFFS